MQNKPLNVKNAKKINQSIDQMTKKRKRETENTSDKAKKMNSKKKIPSDQNGLKINMVDIYQILKDINFDENMEIKKKENLKECSSPKRQVKEIREIKEIKDKNCILIKTEETKKIDSIKQEMGSPVNPLNKSQQENLKKQSILNLILSDVQLWQFSEIFKIFNRDLNNSQMLDYITRLNQMLITEEKGSLVNALIFLTWSLKFMVIYPNFKPVNNLAIENSMSVNYLSNFNPNNNMSLKSCPMPMHNMNMHNSQPQTPIFPYNMNLNGIGALNGFNNNFVNVVPYMIPAPNFSYHPPQNESAKQTINHSYVNSYNTEILKSVTLNNSTPSFKVDNEKKSRNSNLSNLTYSTIKLEDDSSSSSINCTKTRQVIDMTINDEDDLSHSRIVKSETEIDQNLEKIKMFFSQKQINENTIMELSDCIEEPLLKKIINLIQNKDNVNEETLLCVYSKNGVKLFLNYEPTFGRLTLRKTSKHSNL